ncbi:unnamed protein product, partial [Heterosigma akashiwo]
MEELPEEVLYQPKPLICVICEEGIDQTEIQEQLIAALKLADSETPDSVGMAFQILSENHIFPPKKRPASEPGMA